MKTFFKFSILMAVFTIALTGCSKDDDGGGNGTVKLSPPSWIQGTWCLDEAGSMEFVEIEADDVIFGGQSIKEMYSYPDIPNYGVSVKEKKENNLYEIVITARAGGEKGTVTYSFKKVEDSVIEITMSGEGLAEVEPGTFTLYKK